MINIIKKYVSILTTKDIYEFGRKNNIFLTDNEVSIIYEVIKRDYEMLIYNDEKVFQCLENKISSENLNKIKIIFYEYKKKYQNYL